MISLRRGDARVWSVGHDDGQGGDGADGRGQCDVAPSQDQHVIASSGLCGAHQDCPDDHQDVVQEKSAFPEQDGDVITIISNLRPLILTTCRAWRRRHRQRFRPSCRRCRRSRRRRTRWTWPTRCTRCSPSARRRAGGGRERVLLEFTKCCFWYKIRSTHQYFESFIGRIWADVGLGPLFDQFSHFIFYGICVRHLMDAQKNSLRPS